MFKGDFADTCADKFSLMLIVAEWESIVRRPGGKDPRWREQKFCFSVPGPGGSWDWGSLFFNYVTILVHLQWSVTK